MGELQRRLLSPSPGNDAWLSPHCTARRQCFGFEFHVKHSKYFLGAVADGKRDGGAMGKFRRCRGVCQLCLHVLYLTLSAHAPRTHCVPLRSSWSVYLSP